MRYGLAAGALAMWLCGCGSSGHATQDGPGGGRVTVHVRSYTGDGSPDPTAIVVFANATEVVHHGMVDANGDASWDLPGGGTVTVLQMYDAFNARNDELTTFRAVAPGDALQAGPPGSQRFGPATSMTAQLPADASDGMIYFGCGESLLPTPSGQTTLTFYEGCRPSSTFNLLAIANVTGAGMFDYAWQPNTPYVADGQITVADTFAPAGHYTASLTNIPQQPATSNVQYKVDVRTETLVDGFAVPLGSNTIDPTTGMTSQDIMLAYPPGAGNGTVLWEREYAGMYVQDARVAVATSSPATVAWDLSELPLPQPDAVQADAAGVTWTAHGTGSASARVITWRGDWGTHRASWTVIEPDGPSMSSALVPLPADYAADDPTANPISNATANVTYVAYSNAPDYSSAHVYGEALENVTGSFFDVDHHAHATFVPYVEHMPP